MADGGKPRKHTSSFNNLSSLQAYENLRQQFGMQIGVDRLQVNMTNQQRFDDYNFQNELYNFQMEDAIRTYDRQAHLFGLNQQAIDQEVAYQTEQIYSNVDSRLQELAYLQQDLDFGYAKDQIESSYALADNSLMLKINNEQTMQRDRQYGNEMQQQSITFNKEKAEARRTLIKQTLETNEQVGAAAAAGRRGQSARMTEQSIEAVAAIDHYGLYSQLSRGEDSFKNVTTTLTDKKKSDDTIAARNREQLKNNEQKIAQLFGLTTEQYEADTEKLGRMMIDTYASIDTQLQRLSQQEFQSRINLYSKMLLPPRMGPRAKPPREIPYAKYVSPTQPIRYDHKTMASSPSRSSSGPGVLGFLGMAAAGVGTVLTAGAATPAFAAAMPAAGMWGAGLSAAGSILGGLDQRF